MIFSLTLEIMFSDNQTELIGYYTPSLPVSQTIIYLDEDMAWGVLQMRSNMEVCNSTRAVTQFLVLASWKMQVTCWE